MKGIVYKIVINENKYVGSTIQRLCERQAEHNRDYKEYIKEYRKEKFNCECGGKYTLSHKLRHFNSKKHQKYLNKLS
jgi:hypothetical protein